MTTYKGVGVYAGRVIGPVLQMPKPIEEPKDGLRLSGETAEARQQRDQGRIGPRQGRPAGSRRECRP